MSAEPSKPRCLLCFRSDGQPMRTLSRLHAAILLYVCADDDSCVAVQKLANGDNTVILPSGMR